MAEPYIAQVFLFAGSYAPRGYVYCSGQTMAINQYSAVFALVGTVYGGDGQTTFGIPDLRGRVPVGTGQVQLPGGGNYVPGQKGGFENTALTLANLPTHSHQAIFTPPTFTPPALTPPTAVTTINAFTAPTARQTPPTNGLLTSVQDGGGLSGSAYSTAGNATTLGSGAATTVLSGGALTGGGISGGSVAIGSAGASAPFSTLQPFLAMSYIFALEGLFPPRN
jgi:microcystin-dependent protein